MPSCSAWEVASRLGAMRKTRWNPECRRQISGGSDQVRRSDAYLDWVERIWAELQGYLEG
jgi:hypothetical protein